ncbi:DNA polymerase I [Fluviispira multicolorata]|uniref:DNA polymerase I n=1 Tax=Fluviispira multicolorata TaxID=2654512 RepID=A0A833N4V5_9BACT|nr:DNA polymerase I [Fluviispira multicolorata]KAB8033247.1 DNA polymerase I [Fluviispira multicolorata]
MEQQTQRFFIIDGMSLLFRSFYAMGSRLTSPDGKPIGAVYGFLKVFIKILREQNPTHFAVCWDLKEKTFRHEVYPLYKANRGETPPDIIPQIILIQNLLKEIGLPSFAIPGFEADDVAATLAKYFEHYGEVYLVTSDKDYMQIINDKISLFSLKKGDEYDIVNIDKVIDYFGVPPEKVIEVLALAGDAVDNIPGVKGIGEKTAAKLVQEYNSVENIYKNLEKITNKRAKTALENHKDDAMLSRYLVTINTEVPLNISELSLRYTFDTFKGNKLAKEKFEALRMHSLVRNLFVENKKEQSDKIQTNIFSIEDESAAKKQKLKPESKEAESKVTKNNIKDWDTKNYHLVTTKKELNEVFQKIMDPNLEFFAFDTETTGLDILEDAPIGMSFCFETGTAYYVAAHNTHLHGGTLLSSEIDLPEYTVKDVVEGLKNAFEKRKAPLVAHNLKFDLHQLKNFGIEIGNSPACCTMVAAWLYNPAEGGFSLDFLTLKHFDFQKIPTSALIGKETGRSSMLDVPLKDLSDYACEDVDATFRLWYRYKNKLKENSDLQKIYFDIEMPILLLLTEMERNGVHINPEYLGGLAAEIQTSIIAIEKEIFETVGFPFKLTSPKQLGDILFDHLKVHEKLGHKGKLARTTQGYKTDAKVLEQFEEHPIVAFIQQHRELSKLLSTYVLVLPKLIKNSTGRVHTHFNQIGTATGRLSSSDPNMQNIPVRSDWGKKVRAAFSASSSEFNIISADYSQIELRVLAHLSEDKNMLAAFQSGADIHRQTAAQILGKSPENVTSEERGKAKAINFGIIYGMGAQRLAKEQKIPLSDAKKFIEKYFENFSGVKKYLDAQRIKAHSTGQVSTYFGRIRPIPAILSKNPLEAKLAENMAINSPIQGTAADIMKLGMLAVHKEISKKQLKTKIVLQVHDELVFDGPHSEYTEVKKIVKEAMENAVIFKVPMLVDIGQGHNWLEAK